MIRLRKAIIDDLDLLKYWDQKPHVLAADPEAENWDYELIRSPKWRKQLIAELDGRPIGFIQIIDPYREESRYWGEVDKNLRAIDIWIGEEEDLGKGYGTKMMGKAIEICFSEKEVNAILIDPLVSNVRAHKFYERIGFKFVEERYFGVDHCRVYRLNRRDYEKNK